MVMHIPYSFSAQPWWYKGKGAWMFISVPEDISSEIRTAFGSSEQGWGRLKAGAEINGYRWSTSIWYDTKKKAYLLPLKADVRKKLCITGELPLQVTIRV